MLALLAGYFNVAVSHNLCSKTSHVRQSEAECFCNPHWCQKLNRPRCNIDCFCRPTFDQPQHDILIDYILKLKYFLLQGNVLRTESLAP